MKINLRAMMLASGLIMSMIPFMPGEAHAEEVTGQEKRGLMDITYMQEMAPNICENSAENDTKQLIDRRDGKTYWVAKLKDGNCWMTQNLALDLSTSSPLTSELSDVSSSWTPTANTQQGTITKFPSSSDLTLSYNPGEYVYTTPTTQNNCGTSGISKLEGCPNWTLVSGLSKDTSANEQAHYLAGNYYSYNVATAGTGASITSGNATGSICPKGWSLPLSSTTNNNVSGSFYNLLSKYGVQSSPTAGSYDIRLAPLYFVYGGYVDSSTLYRAGNSGLYWSSTPYSNASAYYLSIGTAVNPSSNSFRYYGHFVRCVARTDSSIADNNDNVTIDINPTLSLDIAATAEIPYTPGGISTGNLSATVRTNQQYAIQLSADQPNLVHESDSSAYIPASASVAAGTSAWGIKKKESATGTVGSTTDLSAYTALTTTPSIFYRSAAGDTGATPLLFSVGISTDSAVISGTYSTDVTITATTI